MNALAKLVTRDSLSGVARVVQPPESCNMRKHAPGGSRSERLARLKMEWPRFALAVAVEFPIRKGNKLVSGVVIKKRAPVTSASVVHVL
jgi:hypothetical protein